MNVTATMADLRIDLVPADQRLLPVRLVCGPQLVIGRNKNECDLVSWFLPRSPESDTETLKLSQVHCFLSLEGSDLRIRDANSAVGTSWDAWPVPLGDGLTAQVGKDAKLTLGRNFHISVEWLPVGQPACAVLRPLASEPIFRKCIWMPSARCGFMVHPEEPLMWLHPARVDEESDAVITARGRSLFWCPAGGKETVIQSGATLSVGDFSLGATMSA